MPLNRSRKFFIFVIMALLVIVPSIDAQGKGPFKVYISADMEGVTGVVTEQQLGPGGFEYSQYRQFMTNEVLAAIAGAIEAGATEILVSDSHGNGQNLLIDQFPDDIQIIRSWPRRMMMMEGIDASFDAVVFIGYHSSTTNTEGVRAHTMSSANLAAVRINGIEMPEAGINAAIAGHFGVPVVAISGDDAIVKEAQSIIGPIEGAVVKEAISFHAAKTLTPAAGAALIREKVAAGVARAKKMKPYRLKGKKVTLEVTFKNYQPAELATYLKGVDRVDAHTIRYVGADILEVAAFLEFLLNYRAGLSP